MHKLSTGTENIQGNQKAAGKQIPRRQENKLLIHIPDAQLQ